MAFEDSHDFRLKAFCSFGNNFPKDGSLIVAGSKHEVVAEGFGSPDSSIDGRGVYPFFNILQLH